MSHIRGNQYPVQQEYNRCRLTSPNAPEPVDDEILNDSSEPLAATANNVENQQSYRSRLECCDVNLWDIHCDDTQYQCSSISCSVQCSRPITGSRNLSPRVRILLAMVNSIVVSLIVFFVVYYVNTDSPVNGDTNKYRVCVVDGRGAYKRAGKFCPILDKPESQVECVIGLDRLDCLRRISKGNVDFSVFTAEDLVTATNSQVDVLITNELRFSQQPYEYDAVAIIADDSGIESKHDLQDKRFCHPGYGYESDWTRILANYLEATIVPKSCDESLTLTENRIKASSQYFRSACKAGPWVTDDILDEQLKRKYPNLCALCGIPGRCATNDKYWGRRGPLYCLTDGVGDFSWVRLDDAKSHFGITPGGQASSPVGYSYLCQDGSKRPVNTSNPCVWVSKPWPVIASKRTSAQEIQGFVNRLNHSDTTSWQHALLNLIESYHVDFYSVNPIQAIESYLINVPGFQSANSFSGCHPPRSIRICTESNIENAKCDWMREALAVYGVEPDFDCVKANNKTHCLQAVQLGLADAVLISPDLLLKAQRDYGLKTLLYENVNPDDRYEPVAVVKRTSTIRNFQDLRGKKACFPSYEGIAWNSMLYEFHKQKLLSYECPYSAKAAGFFGDSCAPGVPENAPASLKKLCTSASYEGDFGALKCFMVENADVAFVSKVALKKLLAGHLSAEKWVQELMNENTRILCENHLKPCELSYTTVGEIMVRSSASEMAQHETFDAFMRADELFGNYYTSLTRAFTLYGPFDKTHNVLFHDETTKLRNPEFMNRVEKDLPSYHDVLKEVTVCVEASSRSIKASLLLTIISSIYMIIRSVM